MKLFLDTANIEEIKRILDYHIVSGITTNQTIFARENSINLKEHIVSIAKLINGPISIEVPNQSISEMVDIAIEYAKLHKNIVIKVPMLPNGDGLKLAYILRQKHIPTNITALMTTSQAVLAMLVGGTYVSLFYNRIHLDGRDPQTVIGETRTLIDDSGLPVKIIVGSIKEPSQVIESLVAGAHIVTIPPNVFDDMIKNHKTDELLQEFDKSWKSVMKSCMNSH